MSIETIMHIKKQKYSQFPFQDDFLIHYIASYFLFKMIADFVSTLITFQNQCGSVSICIFIEEIQFHRCNSKK